MKQLTLQVDSTKKPKYLEIANAIALAIQQAQVKENELLPSARELALQLCTTRHTIMAAYNELTAQGWVVSKERSGYKVAEHVPISIQAEMPIARTEQETPGFNWRLTKTTASIKQTESVNFNFNFAGGCPDITLFPFKEFKTHLTDAMSKPNINNYNYGNNAGLPIYIEQVTEYLRRVRGLTNKQVICVNGSQEALYIASQLLLTSGDNVIVESLGYRPAWRAFQNAGANLIAVNQQSDGIDIDHLTLLLTQHKIRFIYLTPLHQYPTTTTMSVGKRCLLYQLALKYQIPIIEDDYDHEFHYKSQPLPPMAANDPAGLVIYISTFSKIMFPGCRLGFIAVAPNLAKPIIDYRTVMNHKSNVLMQDAVARWMQSGGFERHLRRVTRVYHQRRDFMVSQLLDFKTKGVDLAFVIPDGGMALWVNIKNHAKELESALAKQQLYLQSEQQFHLHISQCKNSFIRLGFAGQHQSKTKEGLTLLFETLKEIS